MAGGAPKGNKNAVKLKDAQLRQMAYEAYCAHIASGLSKKCFYFEHKEYRCTFRTLEKYIADNPIEFPPIHKEIAECKSLAMWEKRCEEMALGRIRNCQPALVQIIMRNKFGWDQKDHSDEQGGETSADIILDHLRGHLYG